MKKQGIILLSITIIVVVALMASYQQGLIPVQGTSAQLSTAQDGMSQAAQNSQEDWGQGVSGSADLPINYDTLQLLLTNVDVNQRTALLNDEAAFNEFVESLASQKSLLAAAKANRLDQEDNTRFLMQRSAENTLMEIYVNRLINNKIPADFPTAEQIEEYYESNKDNLVVEARLSVWQIFLPTPQDLSDTQISEIESQARQIVDNIRAGSTDFTNAALTYSAHQPSKLNGGYMGILKISELIPAIQEPLMSLPEGQISDPVQSEMGFHILKRDQIIPSQSVTLEQVRPQIRNLMVNQLRTRLRDEIINLATNTYPVDYDETAVSDWRNRLIESL